MPIAEGGEAARSALRARQGEGARYDAPSAPHDDLLLARRGAAFFARLLNQLADVDLDAPSAREGESRRHVVSAISLRARSMAIAVKSLRAELCAEEAAWRPDLSMAVTLPPRALRHLYAHSDVHLNVEFRDLTSEQWDKKVWIDGRAVPVRELPVWRGRDLWLGAINLNAGASRLALPDRFHKKIS